MLATCNLCQWQVPWGDHIGPALMEAHFRDKHPDVDLYQKPKPHE